MRPALLPLFPSDSLLSAPFSGERGAIISTIIESCRLQQIDPSAALRDVLTRSPTMTNWQVKDTTLQAWAHA